MTLNEKAAYIKGLADGLDYDKTTAEGKIITALLDIIGDITEELEAVNDDLVDLQDYIEEIDEDLECVEDFLDEECEGDCEECDDYDCECNPCYDGECDCDCCDGEYFEVECPSCGDKVCFDESIDPENLICPACGEKFSCTFEDEDEDEE